MMNAILATAGAAFAPVDQHYLFQARQMQALSLAVHIPLVCFGIAFPSLVLFAEWRYLRTGDPLFRMLARRWSKVMLALFAVGVVTGTILSLELGLLWPGFMASFGNVFGLAFALEGISFFVEAIFVAIYVYGWDHQPPRLHFLSGLPVVVAGVAGSLFVISVNGWMNRPMGFTLANGVAIDVQPWSALFANRYFWHEFVHMYLAGYVVAGFLLASAYAWRFLREGPGRYERAAFTIALSAAAVAAPVQVVIGDWAAREVAKAQPVKLAAMEGLARTMTGAPVHVLGWFDGDKIVYGIEIPRLLSLLAFHDASATVQGLDSVPPADRPPVNLVRFAFQTMVGIGTLLAFLSAVYLYVRFRHKRLPTSRWFYRAALVAGPLSVVALIAGWITTEVGRQPWVVYGVMRTSAAVTGAQGIPIGYATLIVVYLLLAGALGWTLRRLAAAPLDTPASPALTTARLTPSESRESSHAR